ncbi:heme ABC transporter ATP-binding protein [Dyadobacter frigoris]|uniref:Heme ABC transporter ATP-binding protein n=1 Tax=Dyadobacter frigoris TaxID=2576211 RepID=A0A4U6D3K4_9BACT|nr:heme ABC transporter ATP-binding protein [Dyadobacter frigoris]TKT91216.1 heme ABC transporter ATP-binding protein [Dyadobacter frigoris]GLU55151.1 hemin import ATP-binding protein HmuV [Dyadobacter frigoris]
MIETNKLHFCVKNKSLLQDINFKAKTGEFWAIVGANGAGKSTLMKVLSKEITPTSGTVSFHGKDLRKYNLKELAQKRAVLAQQNVITLSFTVHEIVLMGRYPFYDSKPSQKDLTIVDRCLQKVGIAHFSDRIYPTLSGGEQQRVQLARTLAQIWEVREGFILLDEPTSGMDLLHQYETFQLAREMTRKGYGVIAVVHDLNFALQYADQVLMLKKGKTFAIGTAHEVLTGENIREAFGVSVRIIQPDDTPFPVIIPEASPVSVC